MRKVSFTKGAFLILFFFFITTTIFLAVKYDLARFDFIKKVAFARKKISIAHIVKHFPFSKESSLKEWEEKVLKGRVVYRIEKGADLSYVRADSRNAASALYYKVKLDVNSNPVISWKWRVDEFPKRNLPESIEDKKEEDFAARVYVIFPAAFFTKSKVIEYIWSETLPKATCGTSGYSKNIKVMVLETGRVSEWHFEKRNIYEDYVTLFKRKPKLNIGAIAFMTDADSTKTTARAVYDEIKIGYE